MNTRIPGSFCIHGRRAVTAAVCMVPLLWLAACAQTGDVRSGKGAAEECARLFADARIDPIRDKVQVPPTLGAAQDVRLLSLADRADDGERPALKVLWDAHTACRRATEAEDGPPPYYRTRSLDTLSALLGDLYDGSLTYGQFARKLLYLGAADRSAGETLDEELDARKRWRALE